MGTPFLKVYEAFLARITADEWTVEEEIAIVERDWQQLLDMAIFRFKYPRVSLEKEYYDPNPDDDIDKTFCWGFKEELSQDEIQLLALYMKHEWVKRCVASWENIRQLYADADFSQANHLDKLMKLKNETERMDHHYQRLYKRRKLNDDGSISSNWSCLIENSALE